MDIRNSRVWKKKPGHKTGHFQKSIKRNETDEGFGKKKRIPKDAITTYTYTYTFTKRNPYLALTYGDFFLVENQQQQLLDLADCSL